ncbi:hypothetical protein [Gloeothece verrucosa]|uniref:Uncharacterized protein n=1 Tax=Gloeothece verrucosa (strain PCC 7822) TaxID=497965 RepID=E0U699_GLOV7|nr:hypothetical protein [Gloeothece verrucosa]ADN12435.1 hypothetical protein Cyan7822_0390 [Gloeothece verrucosa PCC 7822]
MSDWDYEGFWHKAKIYIKYGNEATEDSPLFPFWYFLALELLAKATLAKIHPVLLADTNNNNKEESILYAFERPIKIKNKKPTTISVSTVFSRCESFVDNFTNKESQSCNNWMELRNIELHTGRPAFEGLKTDTWLPEYYRICQIFLAHQHKDLEDLFGNGRGEAAKTAIQSVENDLVSMVKEKTNKAKIYHEQLTPDEIEIRILEKDQKYNNLNDETKKMIECPACKSDSIIQGKIIDYSEHKIKLIDGTFVTNISVLPTKFECLVCRLSLNEHVALNAAKIGGQYTVPYEEDPEAFFWEPDEYMDE